MLDIFNPSSEPTEYDINDATDKIITNVADNPQLNAFFKKAKQKLLTEFSEKSKSNLS